MSGPRRVVVLGGGPDAEREVSLDSSQGVYDGLMKSGKYDVERIVVDRPSVADLRAMKADVIVPVLHGPFGEGGPLQDRLEEAGVAYVGCGPVAARLAMDKLATKAAAWRLGIPTAPAVVFNVNDDVSPLGIPVVVKPVHEGSSVGVHLCKTKEKWTAARTAAAKDMIAHPGRVYMLESLVDASELTVGVYDPQGDARALPPIHIQPATEFYDYEAKYLRDDTKYTVDPPLPAGVKEAISSRAIKLVKDLGVRHLCRVDFLLDKSGGAWMLEVNTMPGFTSHSLYPKAAAHAGTPLPDLVSALVEMAWRDRRS